VKDLGGKACSVVGDLCSDESSKNAVKEAMRLMGGARSGLARALWLQEVLVLSAHKASAPDAQAWTCW